MCYAITEDGGWTGSSVELIQGGGHSYVICNRLQVDEDLPAKDQVGNDTFILDAWAWCLGCCRADSVISNKAAVIAHLNAFHPTKVPNNGSARAGGVKCTLDVGNVRNAAPVRRRCYLTTAACEVQGLEDNCEALTVLRWFRDNILLQTDQGTKDVEEYYLRAPVIVEYLSQNSGDEVYRDIYAQYIMPSVSLIKAKEYDQAYELYKSMVVFLEGVHRRAEQ